MIIVFTVLGVLLTMLALQGRGSFLEQYVAMLITLAWPRVIEMGYTYAERRWFPLEPIVITEADLGADREPHK